MTQQHSQTMMRILDRVQLEDGQYRITIAANETARDELQLVMEGMTTQNYENNPVVMYAHDTVGRTAAAGLPIGRTTKLSRVDGQLKADFEFLEDDAFAQRVRNAWDKRFLNAASVSWLPLDSERGEGDRIRITKSDLLEWSIVAVPADPDALREAHARMLDDYLDKRQAPDPLTPPQGVQTRVGVTTDLSFVSKGELPELVRTIVEAMGLQDLHSHLTSSGGIVLSIGGQTPEVTPEPPIEMPVPFRELVADLREKE